MAGKKREEEAEEDERVGERQTVAQAHYFNEGRGQGGMYMHVRLYGTANCRVSGCMKR